MTKEYWPDGLVDEYTPESLGEPEKWLAILLTPDDVASEAEKDDDEYAAVRGTAEVGETIRFDTCEKHPPIRVKYTADGFSVVQGTYPAAANWFAPADDWEASSSTLEEMVAATREYHDEGEEIDVDLCTWDEEWWQIRSATEIVKVEKPADTEVEA